MCLINQSYPQYQGSIRWKFLTKEGEFLRSPSFMFYWSRANNLADNYNYLFASSQCGLHVYLFQQTAINAAKNWFEDHCDFKQKVFIAKLKCSNFLGGGIIDKCDNYSNGKRGERWGEADILAVYDIDGREVTKMFFK